MCITLLILVSPEGDNAYEVFTYTVPCMVNAPETVDNKCSDSFFKELP